MIKLCYDNDILPISANNCTGTHFITNAVSVSPSSDGSTGTNFTVSCDVGYTLNPGNGSMICIGNIWNNKPTCDGMFLLEILLYFPIVNCTETDGSSTHY